MAAPEHIQARQVYSTQKADGTFYGQIGLRDFKRFESTAKYIVDRPESVLDVGCFCGEWLGYLGRTLKGASLVGIDVSPEKIEQARGHFPHITFRSGEAEVMDFPEHSFDLVTCLEVLEHIPDWEKVFGDLFRFAKRQVLITVPYNQTIQWHVCIHCGKKTPLWGHVNIFTQESFPDVPGWHKTFGRLRDRRPSGGMARKIYRTIIPLYPWLAVSYTRT